MSPYFRCGKCSNKFNKWFYLFRSSVYCPRCGSYNVRRRFALIIAIIAIIDFFKEAF